MASSSSPWRGPGPGPASRSGRRSRRGDSLHPLLEGGECLAGQHEVALLEHVVGVELGDRGDLAPPRCSGRSGGSTGSNAPSMPKRMVRPSRVRLRSGWALVSPVDLNLIGLLQVGAGGSQRRARTTGLVLGFVAQGVRPSSTIAWRSWNFERIAIRMASPDGLLGDTRSGSRGSGGRRRRRRRLALVRPLRPDAGVAGPLLAEELLPRAGDVGPAPGVHGPDPAVGQVHQDDVVQELLVDLAPPKSAGSIVSSADLFAGGVVDWDTVSIGFQSTPRPPRGAVAGLRPGSSGGGQTLFVWRMVRYPPLGPGTAPRIRRRLFVESTRTTLRLLHGDSCIAVLARLA